MVKSRNYLKKVIAIVKVLVFCCRELFERALTLKNEKFFLKKYLEFEEKHGTPETVERLKVQMSA